MITRIKLKQLSDDCAKLLFCSESIEGSNTKELMECNREIKQSLRKIIIANEISDRMIICVTGLQGTGKTSLMKNYYDIEDDIMNIALGRGERLPVLITEDDVSKTCMYAVGIEKIKDGYCTREHQREQPDGRGAARTRRGGGLHGQGQRRPRIPQRGEPLRLLPRHGEVLRQAPQGRPARGRHRPRKLPPIKAAETESVNHNHSK